MFYFYGWFYLLLDGFIVLLGNVYMCKIGGIIKLKGKDKVVGFF